MDAIEYYSDVATDFHASYRGDPNRLERVQVWNNFLNRYAVGATSAYDIGCGSGILACELARRGMETTGIDGASSMLAIAKKSALDLGLSNVRFMESRLPIADTTGFPAADIVISSSAIEYLDSITDALTFLRSLMKDSGVIIFSVSNRSAVSRKIARMAYRLTGRPRYLGFLRHFMKVEDIKAALAASGLIYVEHDYLGRADRLNRILARFLPQRFCSNMIIVVARKQSH